MGSLRGEVIKKAMWLYPKVLGFNPSERWGHSACCSNKVLYVFGGCCGGLHFCDVLMLDLDTMVWSSLVTTGEQPGTRDSHSAVIVGHKMIVLGGTNGSKKVNVLHILDLRTKEWSRPNCEGNPPSPRESHSATVISDDKLVIFGGSGEGEANYLNDIHILDLTTMKWTSPDVKGDLPAPSDSHTAVAIENKLVVYGGDCGDRYHGKVDVLDMDTLTWSRLAIQGSSPGVRAGHAAVNIGTKVYIIGGVGDKHYYNDVWVLDLHTCSWTQLDICGQQPQGRFSHIAVFTGSDIVIYGGCGEDERPLNELLILQLGSEHPNGRYNISLCKIFGSHWNQEKRRCLRGMENSARDDKTMIFGNGEPNHRVHKIDSESKLSVLSSSGNSHAKRRASNPKAWQLESEQEEHSLSLSQHSSPSQSDQEQTTVQKLPSTASESIIVPQPFGLFKQQTQCQSKTILNYPMDQRNIIQRTGQDFNFMDSEFHRHPKTEQFRQGIQYPPVDQKLSQRPAVPPLIGADVHGTVDGAFDSGYLMTANVNGQTLRGVLFTAGPGVFTRAAALAQNPTLTSPVSITQPYSNPNHNHGNPAFVRPHRPPAVRATPSLANPTGVSSDLQGVVLTLGGPGGCHRGS
ncbi:uncharacterized protein LOC143880838 isoform X2 [Tasmannia lanceolata]|uniref:uncharacterized protein LOC143880838 isoform X2 n=1 Tax=Tasmannia lanceolata TaxID=3420 RepID=UPI00406320BB